MTSAEEHPESVSFVSCVSIVSSHPVTLPLGSALAPSAQRNPKSPPCSSPMPGFFGEREALLRRLGEGSRTTRDPERLKTPRSMIHGLSGKTSSDRKTPGRQSRRRPQIHRPAHRPGQTAFRLQLLPARRLHPPRTPLAPGPGAFRRGSPRPRPPPPATARRLAARHRPAATAHRRSRLALLAARPHPPRLPPTPGAPPPSGPTRPRPPPLRGSPPRPRPLPQRLLPPRLRLPTPLPRQIPHPPRIPSPPPRLRLPRPMV